MTSLRVKEPSKKANSLLSLRKFLSPPPFHHTSTSSINPSTTNWTSTNHQSSRNKNQTHLSTSLASTPTYNSRDSRSISRPWCHLFRDILHNLGLFISHCSLSRSFRLSRQCFKIETWTEFMRWHYFGGWLVHTLIWQSENLNRRKSKI